MLRTPFLRNILILSLLIAFALPLYELLVIHPAYEELLLEETEDEAVRYARYLVRTLNLDRGALEKGDIPAHIGEEVGMLQDDALLLKLKVFSSAGEVLFSSVAEEVGSINEKDYFLDVIAQGKVYSKVVEKSALTAEGQPVEADVVETYVPLMIDGRFGGAIEVYYDITASRGRIRALGIHSNLLLLTIAAGLLAAIIFTLFKAKSTIDARQRAEIALQRLNEELEGRVADRAAQFAAANDNLTREIAERKRAENSLVRALGESEAAKEKIDAILRSIVDPLLVTDPCQKVLLMNDAAEKFFAVSQVKALGRPLTDLLPDAALRDTVVSALARQEGGVTFEFERPGETSRHPRVFQGRTSVLQGRTGQGRGMILLIQDVTRERQVERMKNEFVAMVTHELHTPLAAIMGFAELLANQEEGEFSAEQQGEFLRLIYERGEALSRIVNDLLDISRIESGQTLALEKTAFPMNEVVETVVAGSRPHNGKHRFEVVLPEGSVKVMADRGRVVQVLENLLGNAIKYSPNGGLIRVVEEVGEGICKVAVVDEGIGMTPPQVARVFDTFYRVDSSDTAVRGTGLGLSIARHIVESHGGKISVQSEPGAGTVVSFSLPLCGGAG